MADRVQLHQRAGHGFGALVSRVTTLAGHRNEIKAQQRQALSETLEGPRMDTLDLLTPEQAAEALGCEPQHVNDLAAQRKLPAVKYGRSWRFPVAAMNQHLTQLALEHLAAPAVASAQTPMPKPKRRRGTLPDLTQC